MVGRNPSHMQPSSSPCGYGSGSGPTSARIAQLWIAQHQEVRLVDSGPTAGRLSGWSGDWPQEPTAVKIPWSVCMSIVSLMMIEELGKSRRSWLEVLSQLRSPAVDVLAQVMCLYKVSAGHDLV